MTIRTTSPIRTVEALPRAFSAEVGQDCLLVAVLERQGKRITQPRKPRWAGGVEAGVIPRAEAEARSTSTHIHAFRGMAGVHRSAVVQELDKEEDSGITGSRAFRAEISIHSQLQAEEISAARPSSGLQADSNAKRWERNLQVAEGCMADRLLILKHDA